MFKFRTLIALFLFIGSTFAYGQIDVNKELNNALESQASLEYHDAIRSYKNVLAVLPTNKNALEGLVQIYLYDFQIFDSAEVYLNIQLANIGPDTNYRIFLDYANCLRMQEKHEKAIEYYVFFKQYGIEKKKKNEDLIAEIDLNIQYSQNALNNQELIYEPYKVENLDFFINSVDQEYTPVYIEEENLLLYNARYKDYDQELRYEDNKYFENIYYFDLNESVASTYNPGINQESHQAVVSRSYGSDTILVFYKNRVWISGMNQDRLNELIPLPETLSGYYYQPHGVFSSDGTKFIYSARAENGNLDIYISEFKGGNWSLPKSISPRINTSYDEDAPYLSKDGKTLYFSSKGHNSSGGYDFYRSEWIDGSWSAPVNMGYPMNSAGDDIYISFTDDGKRGYFSSNRNGGFGGMDIYSFGLAKKTISGTAKDMKGNLLSAVKVKVTDLETGSDEEVYTDDHGNFAIMVEPEHRFGITGEKEGYFGDANSTDTYTEEDYVVVNLSLEKDPGLSLYIFIADAENGEPLDSVKVTLTDNMTDETEFFYTPKSGDKIKPLTDKKLQDRGSYNLHLERAGYLSKTVTYNVAFVKEGMYLIHEELDLTMKKADLGQDLSKLIDLQPIYFDLGKYNIRPDAALELDKIVKVMNDNPNMRIELGSHTDSRGSATSNQSLSEKRAKSSAQYIQSRITNPERVTYKGYGEEKLVNGCSDGVNCTDEEHQANRRTEFIILQM